MAARGKKSTKKEPECFIIDEEQFESEKEFRRIARPKRVIKSEEDELPVTNNTNKPS